MRAPLKAVTVLVLARGGTVERSAPDLFKRAGLSPGSFYFHVLIFSKRKPLQFQLEKPKARVFGTKAVSKFQFAFKRFRGRGLLTREHFTTLKIGLFCKGWIRNCTFGDANCHFSECETVLLKMRNCILADARIIFRVFEACQWFFCVFLFPIGIWRPFCVVLLAV